jgi:hypothetical protein
MVKLQPSWLMLTQLPNKIFKPTDESVRLIICTKRHPVFA